MPRPNPDVISPFLVPWRMGPGPTQIFWLIRLSVYSACWIERNPAADAELGNSAGLELSDPRPTLDTDLGQGERAFGGIDADVWKTALPRSRSTYWSFAHA